ncbi:MAG: hypothetical protein H7061_08705 [Bdellovibrionaceae bacterium]|nr:hypothetical protein [Bdellovibrio sp.]
MKTIVLLVCLLMVTAQSNVAHATTIRFLTWNVENLFDAVKDPVKDDWEYTPANTPGKAQGCEKDPAFAAKCKSADWTDQKIEVKLSQIQQMVSATGPLPEIFVMIEIENQLMGNRLAKKLGYNGSIVSNGPDARGLNLGILFNQSADLRLVSAEQIFVPAPKPTRPILKVKFNFRGQSLVVFVNHWPSNHNDPHNRVIAAETLKASIEKELSSNPSSSVISTGDFNVVSDVGTGDENPIDLIVNKSWANSQLDVNQLFKAKFPNQPISPGTYYYPKTQSWNTFDRFFISKNLVDGAGIEVNVASFQIFTGISRKITDRNGSQTVPIRYSPETTNPSAAGYSDHFPVIMQLSVN